MASGFLRNPNYREDGTIVYTTFSGADTVIFHNGEYASRLQKVRWKTFAKKNTGYISFHFLTGTIEEQHDFTNSLVVLLATNEYQDMFYIPFEVGDEISRSGISSVDSTEILCHESVTYELQSIEIDKRVPLIRIMRFTPNEKKHVLSLLSDMELSDRDNSIVNCIKNKRFLFGNSCYIDYLVKKYNCVDILNDLPLSSKE